MGVQIAPEVLKNIINVITMFRFNLIIIMLLQLRICMRMLKSNLFSIFTKSPFKIISNYASGMYFKNIKTLLVVESILSSIGSGGNPNLTFRLNCHTGIVQFDSSSSEGVNLLIIPVNWNFRIWLHCHFNFYI